MGLSRDNGRTSSRNISKTTMSELGLVAVHSLEESEEAINRRRIMAASADIRAAMLDYLFVGKDDD